MAETTVKGSKLKQMPKRKANTPPPPEPESAPNRVEPAAETPFDDSPPAEPAPPADPPKKRGNKSGQAAISANASKSILQIIADVPAAYWTAGTARVKIYRLAPLINRHVSSEHRFITECMEPIDEQGLKRECGSGRYRLYLTYKNPAGGVERETARGEIDILDPAYPPKIPAGEWMDDPRNRQWAWAKPKETPAEAAAAPMQTVLEGIRLGNEIRKEAREELQQAQPTANGTQQATPENPVTTALGMAKELLQMKADNPMLGILQAQLTNMEQAAEKSREREAALQKELRDMLMARLNTPPPPPPPAPAAPKTIVEQLTELGTGMEALSKTPLGKLFGFNGAGETAGPIRSRMSGTMEAVKEIAPIILEPLKPLINAAATRMQMRPGQVPVNGNGVQQPQPAANAEQDLIQFVERSLMEPLIEHLEDGDGQTFAQFVYDGWSKRLKPLQNMQHHQMPGQQGAPVIIELFKHSDIWGTQLAHREAEFRKFVDEFCRWKPEDLETVGTDQPATEAAANTETESWDT